MMKLEEFLNIYYNECVLVYIGKVSIQGNGKDIIRALDKQWIDSEIKYVDVKHHITHV